MESEDSRAFQIPGSPDIEVNRENRAYQVPRLPNLEESNIITSVKGTKNENLAKKTICRYGCGCTHLLDPSHREKFWHPKAQQLTDELVQSHFICNECSFASNNLTDLQLHLKRKTAWSNNSLIGCRISCLVDAKEWHEGFVTNYHKSGKHLVEFRLVNEKRWLPMKKTAFYIVERPADNQDYNEFKYDGEDETNLAPLEENWIFAEDITVEYAFAQSVLFKIYGNSLQETGHLTRGHVCVTESDRVNAQHVKSSLLYGELLPRGANKAFGANRLEVAAAVALFDLGMGTGKIVVQAFLQFKNLRYVYGIELSSGRFKLAEDAALLMARLLGSENYHIQHNPGRFLIITETAHIHNGKTGEVETIQRILHLDCGNMFSVQNLSSADIVMMETDVPSEMHPELFKLLSTMKDGSRMLSYLDFRKIFDLGPLPMKQLDINRPLSDRYPTSWSVQRGHHFFLWIKVSAMENITANAWTAMTSSMTYHTPSAIAPHHHQPPRKQSVSAEEQFLERLTLSKNVQDETSRNATFCIPVGFMSFFSRNTKRKVKSIKQQADSTTSQDHNFNPQPVAAAINFRSSPTNIADANRRIESQNQLKPESPLAANNTLISQHPQLSASVNNIQEHSVPDSFTPAVPLQSQESISFSFSSDIRTRLRSSPLLSHQSSGQATDNDDSTPSGRPQLDRSTHPAITGQVPNTIDNSQNSIVVMNDGNAKTNVLLDQRALDEPNNHLRLNSNGIHPSVETPQSFCIVC